MFLSVLHLASSTNGEGYFDALRRTWASCDLATNQTPSKSSLSEARTKVSHHFFKDIFSNALEEFQPKRKTYRGYYVYAIDGDQLDLPASADVLAEGFRGYHNSPTTETHYPKMYTAQVYDVINSLICDFDYSSEIDEVHMARKMCSKLEKDSITLYDRFHCGFDSFYAHHLAGNYFIVRARMVKPGAHQAVHDFSISNKRSAEITWRSRHEKRKKEDLTIRLVKIKNPRTKESVVFATNLPKSLFSDKEISRLYLRRWDIEGNFRDLTSNLKLNQMHSKNVNGILQEIYALLWLVNAVKMQMNRACETASDWLMTDQYFKSNLKICTGIVIENLRLLIRKKYASFNRLLDFWIKKTTESRRRNMRTYPRVLKGGTRNFRCESTVPRRST